MPIPQSVEGTLLDVRRQLAFRDDVEVTTLVLYNAKGEELARLDHYWYVLPPRVRFGDSHESIQFLVVEDETSLATIMAETKSLRYIELTPETPDDAAVEVFSPIHRCVSVPQPQLGRNKKWDIRTTTLTNVSEFFRPPGE